MNSTPTKLDYAIMGLLRETPLSGYQIRQIFETSEMGNYSSSPGSIYPALKRLTRLGLIENKVEDQERSKKRRVFALTSTGRNCLIKWLHQAVSREEVYRHMDELLLRFAFMDKLVSTANQLHFLRQIENFLPTKIQELQGFLEEHSKNIPLNGRLAIMHGIAVLQAHHVWVQKALETLNTSAVNT